ncbi:MAG: hypothetical protein ACKOVH_05835 [Actinomycetota bacterium]
MTVSNERIVRWLTVAVLGGVALLGAMLPAAAADQVWTVVPTPGLGPNTRIESVACVGGSWCVSVGSSEPAGAGVRSLIAMGDGATWSVSTDDDPSVPNLLNGVSCASRTSCFAVGNDLQPPVPWTSTNRIQRWDGASWSVVPSPQIAFTPEGIAGQALQAISCSSASWCAAVGYYGSYPIAISPSFLVWDGTTWAITADPLVVGSTERPYGISCTSATFCVAVGYGQTGGRTTGLLWRWDGSTWTRDAMPDVGLPDSYLRSVSCLAPTWCSAVGIRADGSVPGRTLNVVWDGTAWSVVPTPNLDDQYNYLKGISCATTTSCTAVGDHFGRIGGDGSFGYENLIMFWDGAEWSVVPNPPTVGPTAGPERASLCAGATCPSDTPRNFAERSWFGGVTGAKDPDPVRASAGVWANRLYGVSCFSTSACRATGTAEDGSTPQGFVLAWDGAFADPVPRFTG